MKVKSIAFLSVIAILAVSFAGSFAAGPIYPDLPDLEGQEISIAVENLYPPFQMEDPRADAPIGYEYDLVNEICFRINCVPDFQTTSFDVQIQSVSDGQYDMGMNGLSITEEREEIVDFSESYISLDTFLLGRAGEDRFTGIDDFVENTELKAGVQAGTSGFFIMSGEMGGFIPEDQVADRLVVFNEFGALIQALVAGDIDAIPADAVAAAGFISSTGAAVELIGDPINNDEFAFIFPNDSELVAPFNAALESMKNDGYVDFLLNRWFRDYSPPVSEE